MWSADTYARALDFAARAHGEQKVKDSSLPYLLHVTKVAGEVLHAWAARPDFDVELAVTCALLHDTMEDAGVTHGDIATTFGVPVADGVRALSKDPSLPKSSRLADSLTRLRAQPNAVQLVKLADRITNLEPPPSSWSSEKRREYHAQAQQILAAVGSSHAVLAARLRSRIERYPQFF